MVNEISIGRFMARVAYHDASAVCYIIAPDGLARDVLSWMEDAAARYRVTMVALSGADWNDDLTPWPAPGVFRKAKPFTGNAVSFLKVLSEELIPAVEASFPDGADEECRRTMVGVSLSGLFTLWAGYHSALFSELVSVSGSFWYDGLVEWVAEREMNPAVRKVIISLGDRERNSKDPRMAKVQDNTERIVDLLTNQGRDVSYLLEADTTHFSSLLPRLDLALSLLQ